MAVSVKDFGAVGNGVADDSDAVAAMMAYAASIDPSPSTEGESQIHVHFPAGVYRLTRSSLLSNGVTNKKRQGCLVTGEGGGSILWLDPAASGSDPLYFYDNGAIPRGWGYTFRDLCFAGGNTWKNQPSDRYPSGNFYPNLNARCRGFKFVGPGYESAHKFINCEFRWLNDVLHVTGSDNADTIRFLFCEFGQCGRVNFIDNPQSMSIQHVGSYVVGYGTFLEYNSGIAGGGNFTVTGGAIIALEPPGGSGATLVRAVGGGPDLSNAPVVFQGCRFELRDSVKLAEIANAGTGIFSWLDCSFWNTSVSDKEIVNLVGTYTQMNFVRCSFSDVERSTSNRSKFQIDCPIGFGTSATMRFENCTLPSGFHETFRWARDGGLLQVSGGKNKFVEFPTEPPTEPRSILYDCDVIPNLYSNQSGRTFPLKTAPISGGFSEGYEGWTTQLPPYSRIKAVYARIAGGRTETYRIRIGDRDRATIYAQSEPAPQNAGHRAGSDVILLNVGTDANKRIIRIWGDNGAGGQPAAGARGATHMEAYVEYY